LRDLIVSEINLARLFVAVACRSYEREDAADGRGARLRAEERYLQAAHWANELADSDRNSISPSLDLLGRAIDALRAGRVIQIELSRSVSESKE
jgi:hypothetical protein